MQNTGRLSKALTPSAWRILFGKTIDSTDEEELRQIALVDRAHVLMLVEQGIVERERAVRLLSAIEELAAERFAALRGKRGERGLFLLYEDHLIGMVGAESGGILQTARSRNDLNATVLKLSLRAPYLKFLRESTRLHAVLLRRSRKHANTVMPIYTHGQAAMPYTFGHYLLGIGKASQRDLDGVFHAGEGLNGCPLGGGAVAGTSFPVDAARTSALLGFDSGPLHSLDAVASRDVVSRLLAALVLYGITLSRLAADMTLWTTAEFDFITLPDELTGSSSAMPQKKNPFVLEHVHGMTASLLGFFVHAAGAMHATPFTNSIAVGTEAVKPVWEAFQTATSLAVLLRLLVAGAVPNREAMLRRTLEGFTSATEYANHLVREHRLDFRTAHRAIGEATRECVEQRRLDLEKVAAAHLRKLGATVSFAGMDPSSIAQTLEAGGGPGPLSFRNCWGRMRDQWVEHCRRTHSQKRHWQLAELNLKRETDAFLAAPHHAAAFCGLGPAHTRKAAEILQVDSQMQAEIKK